jgi:NAD(P)-dependent dehydrogenase (short-subunit alcohol dehydrogenase family)
MLEPIFDLAGRTAVVIGGGSGIGRGIALGLGAEGMRVVVADIDLVSARTVADELTARGVAAAAAHVDSTRRDSLAALATRATTDFQFVHVLVNTVGVIFDCPLSAATDDDWAWMFELNVMSQVRAVDIFLPHLRASGGRSHIVLTASVGGVVAAPDMPIGLYVATKHALVAYGEMLRAELGPEHIGVSVLCPSGVVGNLAATSARERLERLGKPIPRGSGEPPDPSTRTPSELMGPLVARAIESDRFFIFNRPDAVTAACEQRLRLLRRDAESG